MKITFPFTGQELTLEVTNERGEDFTNEFCCYIANVLFDSATYNRNNGHPITADQDKKMATEMYLQLKENGYYEEL